MHILRNEVIVVTTSFDIKQVDVWLLSNVNYSHRNISIRDAYTHTHTPRHTHTYVDTHTYIHTHAHTYTHTGTCTHKHKHKIQI